MGLDSLKEVCSRWGAHALEKDVVEILVAQALLFIASQVDGGIMAGHTGLREGRVFNFV